MLYWFRGRYDQCYRLTDALLQQDPYALQVRRFDLDQAFHVFMLWLVIVISLLQLNYPLCSWTGPAFTLGCCSAAGQEERPLYSGPQTGGGVPRAGQARALNRDISGVKNASDSQEMWPASLNDPIDH